ncbi:MAG: hypothetical protein ABIQ95_05195 [Bdellovibrionia bacterium]
MKFINVEVIGMKLSAAVSKSLGLCFSLMGLLFISNSAEALTNNTRATYPTAITLELGGRGFLYSINFDRVLNDNLAAGVGIGNVTANSAALPSISQSSMVIPVYFNYYFMPDAGSFYLTGGADLLTNAGSVSSLTSSPGGLNFSSSPILLTVGVGYELRSDAGYLVRAAGYGIYGGSLIPWGGISFGSSF